MTIGIDQRRIDGTKTAINDMIIIMIIAGWSDKNTTEEVVGIVTSVIIHLVTT